MRTDRDRLDQLEEQIRALEERLQESRPGRPRVARGHVVLASLVLALLVSPFAIARTGDSLREGLRNPATGSAARETQIISGVTGNSYGTRQSNISTGPNAGGAAVYGCRRSTRECTRHVNLAGGPAAHFQTSGAVPFTIAPTATGMVAGLNAERVGGLTAAQLRGQTGQAGPPGPQGPQGPPGPFPQGDLPGGVTLRGMYALGGAEGDDEVEGDISFLFQFASVPARHFIPVGQAPPAACPGSDDDPQAAPGHVCIYESRADDREPVELPSASRWGVLLRTTGSTGGDFHSRGTWAATSP
jgi:hypothetical protein